MPSVRERTLEKLRRAIIVGELAAGQRLIEHDLVKRLGVSRPTLREIFFRLAAERLIKHEPNKGPSVAEISWQEAAEIYELRELLEGQAAGLFAKRATAAELAEMRQALDDFGESLDQPIGGMELLDATERFYAIILDGCGNRLIGEVLRGQLARISVLRARSMSRRGRTRRSFEELSRILNAIAAGDPDGARNAAVEHVRHAQHSAQVVFQSQIF